MTSILGTGRGSALSMAIALAALSSASLAVAQPMKLKAQEYPKGIRATGTYSKSKRPKKW